MNELQRRLREVVDVRYGGVASRASLAAGLNENAVLKILRNPKHKYELETLDQMAQTFGWSLCDVVHWSLNRVPATAPRDPAEAIAQILAAAGYEEGDREYIIGLARRFAPESRTVESEQSP